MILRSDRWNRLVDLAVRLNSRDLGDGIVVRRKLLHTSQVLAVWPLMTLDRRLLGLALLGSSGFVATTQRRWPYASLGLLSLLAIVSRPALGGAWVVFTAGDGVAGIAGRLLGSPRLPWNRAKTWAGSAGFVIAAAVALFCFLRRWQPALSTRRRIVAALLTSLAAGVVESLRVPLDDNFSVIVVAGAVLEIFARCSAGSRPSLRRYSDRRAIHVRGSAPRTLVSWQRQGGGNGQLSAQPGPDSRELAGIAE